MARRKRQTNTFNLSFLDIMSCGFGAVVLVFLIIDHSIETQIQSVNAEVLSEVDLLEEDIREGEEGLVRLRNAISSTDLDIVEAQGRARVVTEELDALESLLTSLEKNDELSVDQLKAELLALSAKIEELNIKAAQKGGINAADFQGEGNRQNISGLKMGGNRIAIFLDTSASMLDIEPGKINQFRIEPKSVRRQAPKWKQAVLTAEWLLSNLPLDSRYQLILFNESARFSLGNNDNAWKTTGNKKQLDNVIQEIRGITPDKGTNLRNAFAKLNELTEPPDNIFLITDGLPTLGEKPSQGGRISSGERKRLFNRAVNLIPRGVPVNTILLPMRGDPEAAEAFWRLAQQTSGALMAPAADWP